jgi:hypothetical protein
VQEIQLTRRVALASAATAIVVAGGSAVAVATTQSSSNVYQACLQHNLGAIYQVEVNPTTSPRCLAHDTLISWNQTGPAGAAGPQGPKGDAGAAGPQGPKGDTGAVGAAGPAGSQGAAGPAGLDGKTVLSGTGVPSISTGTNGDFYLDTTAHAIYRPKNGGWGNPTSLTGAQGPKGDTGTPGPQGPQGAQGVPGNTGQPGPLGLTGPSGVAGLYWITASATVGPFNTDTLSLRCHAGANGNPGDNVYGGGASIEGPAGAQSITESGPSGDLTASHVTVSNDDLISNYTFHIYAICGPSGLTITNDN